MPGRASQSRTLQIVATIVALVAVVGTVALGWKWGETDQLLPLAIGAGAAIVAVGWTLYDRFG